MKGYRMRLPARALRLAAVAALAVLPSAALAQQVPLNTRISGAVVTIGQGWQTAWVTSCPTLIKVGAGVLGGVRNATSSTTSITWTSLDGTDSAATTNPVIDSELPGLQGGQIVTTPFPGAAFNRGLVFSCSGALPATPTGLPGPIAIYYR